MLNIMIFYAKESNSLIHRNRRRVDGERRTLRIQMAIYGKLLNVPALEAI
jgi:hypothetical protein